MTDTKPFDEIMKSLDAYKKYENKLRAERKRIDDELERIAKQKIILAIMLSGGDPKYVEEVFFGNDKNN